MSSEHAAEATPYRIYLASSWRNPHQERCLEVLLRAGFAVYDFKHPNDSDSGFSWRTIDPEWKSWAKNPRAFFAGLRNRIAMEGFRLDMTALDVADACVLVLPAGNSAHLEAGFAIGKGKPTVIVCHEGFEPELMYLAVDLSDQRVSDTRVACEDRVARSVRHGEQGETPLLLSLPRGLKDTTGVPRDPVERLQLSS